jgi:hypothetical protein
VAAEKTRPKRRFRDKMLVRALKVLRFLPNEETRTGIDTAALDQPADEGWAYGRAKANWQR